MNDSFENSLKNLRAPAPDARARLAAKEAALAQFARAHAANDAAAPILTTSQGTGWFSRLFRDDQSRGRTSMGWLVGRSLYGAVASACVVAFGAAMLWPVFTGHSWTSREQIEPASVQYPAERPPELQSQPRAHVRNQAQEPTPPPPPPPPAHLPTTTTTTTTKATAAAAPVLANTNPVKQREVTSATPASSGNELSVARVEQKPDPEEADGVTVTGYRATLKSSMQAKRQTAVDSIQAEDIGRFPDSSRAEALQRVNGVAVGNDQEQSGEESRDRFRHFDVNPVKRVADEPVSTFSADVDTASYSFTRRAINEGRLPPKDAVRVEEMVNYFDYAWPLPDSRKEPFEPTIVVTDSPWGKGRKLVTIGIKGYDVPRATAPDVNLVLLLDVSGSMDEPDKLPLAVKSMELLLDSLKPTDTVGIVVYAGEAGTVLEPTPVGEREKIVAALRSLHPGGSTAGAQGIAQAYDLAERHFRKGGVNRILLATDGDFNVGISDSEALKGFVERKREDGVMLSVLGFGEGNYRDELAQELAQNGNGAAAYIDTLAEARKVLVREASSTLFTIAKDVKLQVEFNPSTVAEYRLVGYETRALRREDFNNDRIDAGDIGSGHTVTAIYEITPVGSPAVMVDESRYPENDRARAKGGKGGEYGFLKIRYKLPGEDQSKLITAPIRVDTGRQPAEVMRDVRFSTAVAGFAQLLDGGSFTGRLTYEDVLEEAQASVGDDRYGYRGEFVELVRKARAAKRVP